MELTVISGAPGAGKSTHCFLQMQECHASFPEEQMILVVPDQYSYLAERRLVEYFGGMGLNQIEVITFRRMVNRYLSIPSERYLTPAGKQILLYEAASAAREGMFEKSAGKAGFIDTLGTLICEFKRYHISPQILREKAQAVSNPLLQEKLRTLAAVYQEYNALFEDRFLDSEDDLQRVAEYFKGSGALRDTHIWMDEFDDFLPQHYQVIDAMVQTAKSVRVTLRQGMETTRNTYDRLERLAQDLGIFLKEERLEKSYRYVKSKELLEYYGNRDNLSFCREGETKDISLFQSRDVYGEVEYTASKILDLVREEGYRFREIGILCGDLPRYQQMMEAVFEEYQIPYFTDNKILVTDHPIVMLLLSVFDLLDQNWSYDTVFRYLRTGFVYEKAEDGQVRRFPLNDIDRLENYVLEKGIRSIGAWQTEEIWTEDHQGLFDSVLEKGEKKQLRGGLETIDQIRRRAAAPLLRFKEATQRRKTVRVFAEALFQFFNDICLYEGLSGEICEMEQQGNLNEAEQFRKIWNLLLQVLDQTVVIFGEKSCNRKEFGNYIRAGLSKAEIRIIPSGLDQVNVGTVERSISGHVRALFVVGAYYGAMPAEITTEGILSDRERNLLSEQGMELAPDTKKQMRTQQAKLQKAVAAAAEKLYFSHPLQDTNGDPLRPAQLLTDLLRMYPDLTCSDNLLPAASGRPLYLSSPKATLHQLFLNLSPRKRGMRHPLWDVVYRWYGQQEEWRDSLHLLETAKAFEDRRAALSPETARQLYGENRSYSASRLQEFSQCPFCYFVKNGLRAREQKVWEIRSVDLGSLIHWAIQEYCIRVDGEAKTAAEKKERWDALTQQQSHALLDAIMEEVCGKVTGSVHRDQRKLEHILLRVRRTLKRSAETVRLSLQHGEYAPAGYEKEFDMEVGSEIHIHGIIDRVDLLEKNRDANLRIIDYKSGSKSFDPLAVYNGLDMQLMIYALAAVDLYEKGALPKEYEDFHARVTGVFYNKVRDDLLSCQPGESGIAERSRKAMRLDGMAFVRYEGEEADVRELYAMDHHLTAGKESPFLKLALTAKKAVNKRSSSVGSEQNGQDLMDHVSRYILDTDRRIKRGAIEVKPYRYGKQTGCEYCDYAEICLFDREHLQYREIKGQKKGIWKELSKEREVRDHAAAAMDGGSEKSD